MKRRGWGRPVLAEQLTVLSFGLLLGIGLCRWSWLIWAVLSVGVLLVVRYRNWLVLTGCLLFGVIIGVWRGQQVLMPIRQSNDLLGQSVTIQGQVIDDPVYVSGGQTEAYLQRVRLVGGPVLPGKVRVRGYTLSLQRGDSIMATGKLKAGFGGYVASMYYAQIEVMSHDQSWMGYVRRRFQAGLLNSLPEPHGSFGFGLLVGARSGLPASMNNQLAAIGLTHIVAVSGYNLTILVQAARRGLKRFSPRVSAVSASLLIASFLLITGFSASIVRASIVAGLSLAAGYYGRTVKPATLLLLSASITAVLNPLYLWGDLGWWLSFLAFAGVLLLAPVAAKRSGRNLRTWQSLLLETMCAIALTTPLILFVFGRLSMIAPLSNVLILPFIPLAMLVTALAGVAGMLLPVMAGVLALPGQWLLGLIIGAMQQLSAVPGAQRMMSIDRNQMAACYALLALAYFLLTRKQRSNDDIIGLTEQEI